MQQQQQSWQSQPITAYAQQQTPGNEPAKTTSNENAPGFAQRKAQSSSNSNGANGDASTSATATVEGWVSHNLTAFLSDPASGPDLPMSQIASTSGAPAAQQQSAQQQQQQQQKRQSTAMRGANSVTVEASQSWGSVKQKGPAGAWQGSGQGQNGGSGGSWTHVDDQMEDARRFLSPWRWLILPACTPLVPCLNSKQKKYTMMHSSDALLMHSFNAILSCPGLCISSLQCVCTTTQTTASADLCESRQQLCRLSSACCATTVIVVAAVVGTVHADIMPVLTTLVLCIYVCVCVCRALVSPVVKGAQNLPDPLGPRRPLLFIGKLHPSMSGVLSSYCTELADTLRGLGQQDCLLYM